MSLPVRLTRLVAVLVLALFMVWVGSTRAVLAASPAAPHATTAAIPADVSDPAALRALIDTLEDPAARATLVGQLRAMMAAQGTTTGTTTGGPQAPSGQAAAAAQPGHNVEADLQALGDSVADGLTLTMSTLGGQLSQLASAFADLPQLMVWAGHEISQESWQRNGGRLLLSIGAVVLVLLAGVAADALLALVTRRLRNRLLLGEHRNLLSRLLGLVAMVLLDLLQVLGFAGGGYGVLALLAMQGHAQLVALTLLEATVVSRLVMVLVRAVTAYRLQTLRLLPVGDETAAYLHVWARRLVLVAVYGYFLGQLALFSGLPVGAYAAWVKLVGLVITCMVVIVILQNQQTVEDWIKRLGEAVKGERDPDQDDLPGLEPVASEGETMSPADGDRAETGAISRLGPGLRLVRNWLAELWHIVAILYVVAIFATWAIEVPGGFRFLAGATVQTAVLLVVGLLLSRLAQRLIQRGFAIPRDMAEALPGLEKRANRYLPVLKSALRLVVWLTVLLGVLHAWGIDSFAWLTTPAGRGLLSTLVTLAVLAALTVVIWELVSSMIERRLLKLEQQAVSFDRAARLRTLLPLARRIFTIVLGTVFGLIALSELGVDIGPLLAGAGILGVAIGFGSQKLVQDIITGLFMLIEDQVSVGDVIDTGSHAGVVEAINLRTIRLRDLSGTVHVVPFSEVTSVKNLTREYAYAVMDIGVAYREDVDEVIALIERIGAELQEDPAQGPNILEPITIFGVDEFADSAVVIKCRIKTLPLMQWGVKRAFNRLMKLRFDEHGIEIPFPHQTIYFGELKNGKAPPAHVRFIDETPDDEPVPGPEHAISEEEKARALSNLSDLPADGDA